MSLLGFFCAQICLVVIGGYTTVPVTETNCNGFSDFLRESPLITTQYKPKPYKSSFTSITWKNYGKARPQVVMMICEFTSISGISFGTSNVKSSGLIIDGESYYGAVDQFGKVDVSIGSDFISSLKFGWEVKISIVPKNISLPAEIKDLVIKTCGLFYDCFDDCPTYILESDTGCKRPICKGEPCYDLNCPETQECRLIQGEPLVTFPHLWGENVQLWGCVDKERKDYGCFCNSYVKGENTCPTCQCGGNLTTTAAP